MKFTKYKSFSHWFYYHKIWIIAAVIVALMILTLSWTHRAIGPKADYRVSWVGETMLSQEEEASITAAVSSLGQDVNGDGEVTVEVVQYAVRFTTEGTAAQLEENYGTVVKLIGQLETNECYLYLMEDPEGFQYAVGALRYLDGEPSGEEDHYEYRRWREMCAPWSCPGLERRTVYLGRRALFDEGQEYEELFPGGEALFQALISG